MSCTLKISCISTIIYGNEGVACRISEKVFDVNSKSIHIKRHNMQRQTVHFLLALMTMKSVWLSVAMILCHAASQSRSSMPMARAVRFGVDIVNYHAFTHAHTDVFVLQIMIPSIHSGHTDTRKISGHHEVGMRSLLQVAQARENGVNDPTENCRDPSHCGP